MTARDYDPDPIADRAIERIEDAWAAGEARLARDVDARRDRIYRDPDLLAPRVLAFSEECSPVLVEDASGALVRVRPVDLFEAWLTRQIEEEISREN